MEFTPHTDRDSVKKVGNERTSRLINHARSLGITNASLAAMLGVAPSRISEGRRPDDSDKKRWQLTEAEYEYLVSQFGEPRSAPGELMTAQVLKMTGKSTFELTFCILGWTGLQQLQLIPNLLEDNGQPTRIASILQGSFQGPHSFEQWFHSEDQLRWLRTYLPLNRSPEDLPTSHATDAHGSFRETLQAHGYTKNVADDTFRQNQQAQELHLLMVLATFRAMVSAYLPSDTPPLALLTNNAALESASVTDLVMTALPIWSGKNLRAERFFVANVLDEVLGCIEEPPSGWVTHDDLVGAGMASDLWRGLHRSYPDYHHKFNLRLYISKTHHYHLLLSETSDERRSLLLTDIMPDSFFGLVEFLSGGSNGLSKMDLWEIRKSIAANGGYLPGVTVVD